MFLYIFFYVFSSYGQGKKFWRSLKWQKLSDYLILWRSESFKVFCYCLAVSDSLATQWTVAHQAPLFMGFQRQEYWSGIPFPSPSKSFRVFHNLIHCRKINSDANNFLSEKWKVFLSGAGDSLLISCEKCQFCTCFYFNISHWTDMLILLELNFNQLMTPCYFLHSSIS